MPKSFKEIGRKTEDLIEQGREADRQVSSCASRVASLNAAVANAQRELAQASSETDENGNPSGDVAGAQARLNMAKNQLAAGQRALSNAKQHANAVKSAKQSHASEIEKHNRVERGNISKLKKLQTMAFGGDSAALIHGMAERLNEAEDARVKLLKSMGIDATPEYMNVSEGGGGSMGGDRSLRRVGISGEALHYQGGSGGAADAMGGVSLTLDNSSSGHGAGLSFAGADVAAGGISINGEGIPAGMMPGEIGPGEFHEAMPQGMPASEDNEFVTQVQNSFPSFDPVKAQRLREQAVANAKVNASPTQQEQYDALRERIDKYAALVMASRSMTAEQKKTQLTELRNALVALNASTLAVNNPYINVTDEASGQKTLKPTKEYMQKMFDSYVDNIMEVYRSNLLDHGAVSVGGLDMAMSEMRRYYSQEARKELSGQTSNLYSDPDYDKIVSIINRYRPPIAGISAGEKMDFARADSGHVNPDYGKLKGSDTNCQSSVVVFEARQRGYDVKVLPNTKGSMLEKLSHDTKLAWIDPKTGKHPDYIYDNSKRTPDEYLDFVKKTVQPGGRYTIQFAWKDRVGAGHIVNIDRDQYGSLRIKDNQRGIGERSEWVGDQEVKQYLSDMKYEIRPLIGDTIPCVPKLLRIDNMDFDYSVVGQIMKGAK